MKQFTSGEIQERFEKLPEEVQKAVTSSDVNAKIEAIGKKYQLHVDQLGELVDEVGLVMLGLQKSSFFTEDLCSRLSISRDVARSIGSDINEDIFSLIKAHLMEMNRESSHPPAPDMEHLSGIAPSATTTITNKAAATDESGVPKNLPTAPETRTEPLTDHLLTTPVTVPPQKLNQPDPYKELIN